MSLQCWYIKCSAARGNIPTKMSEEAVKFRYRINYNDGSRQIKNSNHGQGKFSRYKRFVDISFFSLILKFTATISSLHLLTQNQFTVFSTLTNFLLVLSSKQMTSLIQNSKLEIRQTFPKDVHFQMVTSNVWKTTLGLMMNTIGKEFATK